MGLRDYVLMLAGSCLICGGLTILAPNGQFGRFIRLIAGIFLLLCMFSPIKNTWTQFHHNKEYLKEPFSYAEDQSWDYTIDIMSKTLHDEIQGYVVTVLGHPAQRVEVDIQAQDSQFSAKQIAITLQASDMGKAAAVADYVAIKIGVRPYVISASTGE